MLSKTNVTEFSWLKCVFSFIRGNDYTITRIILQHVHVHVCELWIINYLVVFSSEREGEGGGILLGYKYHLMTDFI